VPTSVLLAVLAAAGLLALAPALVRRYDATERLVAERAQSTARVLQRRRRLRSVPGRRPINRGRQRVVTLRTPVPAPSGDKPGPDGLDAVDRTGAWGIDPSAGAAVGGSAGAADGRAVPSGGRAASSRGRPAATGGRATATGGRVVASGGRSGGGSAAVGRQRRVGLRAVPRRGRRSARPQAHRHTPAVVRRRRVFAALLLLNLVELVGVATVGPGFWIGFSVTGTLLLVYLVHLRNRAIADRRRQRIQAREAAWLAQRQAEVRREQARRAAVRREAQRRLAAQREAVRRAAMGLDREPAGDLPAVAGGTVAGSVSYRRRGAGLRGRAYEAGGRGGYPA
jgi:hypothetical protein